MANIARFYTIECFYCGVLCDGTATVDHLIPVSKGGSDHRNNKVYACRLCNWAKGNRSVQDFKLTWYWHTVCKNKIRKGKYEDEFPEYRAKKPPKTIDINMTYEEWQSKMKAKGRGMVGLKRFGRLVDRRPNMT